MSTSFEMKRPTNLLARLAYEFSDVPEGMLFDALNDGARKISKRNLLECTIDLTDRLQCGEDTYEFDDRLPEGLELSAVRFVKFCGCCIDPLNDKCDDCSCGYRVKGNCAIVMQPAIDGEVNHQTLEVCVSLRPKYGVCELPNVLCEQFPDQLMDYARAFIQGIPNTPHSNLRESRARKRSADGSAKSELSRIQNNHRPGGRARFGRRWLFQ